MMQRATLFVSSQPSRASDLLLPRRARFMDPEFEAAYRHDRLGDHLKQLRVFILFGIVATVYFIPSDILFYGWGERAQWLLLVRTTYILISIACLIYSFRLSTDRLTRVAFLWFMVTILSQVIISTNRPSAHVGNIVIELVAILLIYLLLPVTVYQRFYAAGALTLFVFWSLFLGLEQQPQEMVRALAFAVLLANVTGIIVSYRHERMDRLQYYLLRSERAARTELEQANAELDAFSHTVAHDLKNPINAIQSGVRLLRNESAAPGDASFSDEIYDLMEEAAIRQQRIVNDLLLLAQVRRGLEPPQNNIEMDELLRRVIAFLQTDVRNAGATVKVVDQVPAACGYGSWIEQVWVNYLINAIKYGGDSPRIECGGRMHDDLARFYVRDYGPGISQEKQGLLFTEFTRLNQVKIEGHGLGLSVVRRIVNALGGEVGFDSPDGGGAEFWFTLPVQCGSTETASAEPS